MACKELEFRGIGLSHLGSYFEELGAERISHSFPYIYKAVAWSGEILSEEFIKFTPNFSVNAVKISFVADNEDILELLIKNYRYKTTRVGG